MMAVDEMARRDIKKYGVRVRFAETRIEALETQLRALEALKKGL